MIASLIYLVIILVIVCCVFAVALYACDNLIPAPIQRYVHVGIVVVWALVVLLIILQHVPSLVGYNQPLLR